MYKFVSGVALIALGLTVSAAARDLPRAPYGAPPVETFSWAGPYAGVFFGAGRTTSTATETTTTSDDPDMCAPAGTAGVPAGMFWCNVNNKPHYSSTPTPSFNQIGDTWQLRSTTTVMGVTAGYNWQFGRVVVGGEVDGGYMGAKGSSDFSPASIDDTRLHVEATTFATARLRLGYAMDRLLVFGTVGAAMGSFNAFVDDPDTPIGIKTTPTVTQFGIAFGGGAEYAVTDHIILKGDFLSMMFNPVKTQGYVNLTCYPGIDSAVCDPAAAAYWKTGRLSDVNGAQGAWNVKHTVNIGRIGLAYKF